jgi:probable HAF family extracellular repeat protein
MLRIRLGCGGARRSVRHWVISAAKSLFLLVLPAALGLSGSSARATDIQYLGSLPDFPQTYVRGMSADGSAVVGTSETTDDSQAFRWTVSDGMRGLGYLPGVDFSRAFATSAHGDVVVGDSETGVGYRAFRWTLNDGMVDLGTMSSGSYSTATGVSADGSVVVGRGNDYTGRTQAFRWTSSTGMVALGFTPDTDVSQASAVSSDGSTVVGECYKSGTPSNQAFRWTASGGMVGLGSTASGDESWASGVSSDGSTVVGNCYKQSTSYQEAFRWTASSGMVGLGRLPGTNWSTARGTSGDGSVVVGYSGGTLVEAFVWDKVRGMQNLKDLLVNEFGMTSLADCDISEAYAISADGLTIVGRLYSPDYSRRGPFRVNLDGVTRSWAGTSDTSWDQPGNWTKWGKPGPQTTVVINPNSTYSVTGPVAAATVLSLTVGAKQSGVASLTLGGPSLSVTNGIEIQSRGRLDLNAGVLSAQWINNAGTFNQLLGASASVVTFENTGTAVVGGSLSAVDSIENLGTMTIQSEATVTADNGLSNLGTLTIEGGTIQGMGVMLNDGSGQMTARGTIGAILLNYGNMQLSGVLSVNNESTNLGQITIGSGHSYRTSGSFSNCGIVELGGGSIAGNGGTFSNDPGGLVHGRGLISAPASNQGGLIYADDGLLTINSLAGGNTAGGELRVGPGCTMNVNSAFASSGLITLEGGNARFGGGAIANSGTIVGSGQVSNTVQNSGIIRAENGQLTLSGAAITNTTTGQIQIPFGASVLLSQGLTTNAGTIAMMGGTFDTNNTPMTNGGTLAGNGTIRTKSLTNNGKIKVADANTAFYGPVTNNSSITITESTTTFYGLVTNNSAGSIKTTAAMVRYLGGFINNGTYSSDPSTQYFEDLTVGESGALVGGAGDKFIIGNDLHNASTQNAAWCTDLAELSFAAGLTHVMELAGVDRSTRRSGYDDNFSWGILSLGAGASLVLQDGNASPGGAQYLHEVLLADGIGQIGNITGNGLSLYYDPTMPSNGYLCGQTYALAGGGVLAPVPEPGTLTLLTLGAIAILLRYRRHGTRT